MSVYITYNKNIDEFILYTCVKHYTKTILKFTIVVKDIDLTLFKNKYNDLVYLINSIPENALEISEKDFLFSYDKTENDHMILSYDINENFINTSICIGKLYYVPVTNLEKYTTFEIPDFILYEHNDHTNYTINGIKLNGCKEISKNIVCLNLNISEVASETEYYENNALIIDIGNLRHVLGRNINLYYSMNVVVNKTLKYGIIWYSKCGCSTISNIFCNINNIDIIKANRRSINFHTEIYRYNVYLQNIDFISFVRNPYNRFLSSFIDKNVDQVDEIFLQIYGYTTYINTYKNDNINNLCDFLLQDGYITEHYTLMCKYDNVQKIKTKVCKMEDNLNVQLLDFLGKYHEYLDISFIKTCRENINSHNKNDKEEIVHKSEDMNQYNFTSYNRLDWLNYLSTNKLDYNKLIQNTRLRELIYKVYQKDFLKFNYKK